MTTTPRPEWHSLSHYGRYKRLNEVRSEWCNRRFHANEDARGRTVTLEGAWIDDVPSFYLSLGEAINGPNGYFGGGLDALSDCLCGDFGVLPPLTIRLRHFDEVRKALDARAWCRWRAESFRKSAVHESTEQLIEWGYFGDGSDEEIARWTALYEAALAGEACDCDEFDSYFDSILEVLEQEGATLVPEPASAPDGD